MAACVKVGISSCMLGYKVRYDGGHKLDDALVAAFASSVRWVPVCPETESGLTVPREPMMLTGDPEAPRIVTICTGTDHTDLIVKWSLEKIESLKRERLRGFIFKSKSPSSGMRDIEVRLPSGTVTGSGIGIFARLFMGAFPLLPVEDEERLRDPAVLTAFMGKVFDARGTNILY